jgi:hypothetical protein
MEIRNREAARSRLSRLSSHCNTDTRQEAKNNEQRKDHDMISRKHFQMIADELKSNRPEAHWDANKMTQWQLDVRAVAKALSSLNPRFDFARFYKACGFEQEQEAA